MIFISDISRKLAEVSAEISAAVSGTTLTIGYFDGVHLGHRAVITRTVKDAVALGLKSMVFTFANSPKDFFSKTKRNLPLSTAEERKQLIENLGVDILVMPEFTKEIADIEPEEFIEDYLVKRFKAKEIVVGHDYKFGKSRKGDYRTFEKESVKLGYKLKYISPVKIDNTVVSSSKIRQLIKEGDIEKANKLLGYKYFVSGEVVRGRGEGKGLGFPTANIFPTEKCFFPTGVYAVYVTYDSNRFKAVMSYGTRPTVERHGDKLVEVHILDPVKPEAPNIKFQITNKIQTSTKIGSNFNHDLLGKRVKIELVRYLRPEKKFAAKDELITAIKDDIKKVNSIYE